MTYRFLGGHYYIKGLEKNPKEIASWAGFPMNKQEALEMYESGIVPKDIFELAQKYSFNPYRIPDQELKEFGKNHSIK